MLKLEQLESRENPSGIFPGFDGPVHSALGEFNGDLHVDKVYVAGETGSARVMVVSGLDDSILLNTIAFDPNFRGGGRLKVVGDTLFVVPGLGGGPVVEKFSFNPASGGMDLESSFFAPFPIESRTGLYVSGGDVDGDGVPEALFISDGNLVAVDLRTHETESSIYVGDGARFEPTGGTITIRDTDGVVRDVYWIEYGDVIDGYVERSAFFTFDGREVQAQ